MTYLEKLKDPRWQKKRLEIFERDKWSCTCCMDNTKTLHVHHLDYLPNTEPWQYDNSFLTTLCEDCHTEITEQRPVYEKKIISELRLKLKNSVHYDYALWSIQEYDMESLFCYLFYNRKNKDEIMCFLGDLFRNQDK